MLLWSVLTYKHEVQKQDLALRTFFLRQPFLVCSSLGMLPFKFRYAPNFLCLRCYGVLLQVMGNSAKRQSCAVL